ncbi:hypothetical protein ACQXZL_10960 [Corynebacterium diphtheriae]
MDFSKSPVTSIVLNAPVNDYSAILTDFKFFDNPLFSHLSGKLLIGESMRNIKFGAKRGMVTSAEIIDIVASDSFMGIPLSQRAKTFYHSLLTAGIEAKMDKWGIELDNQPVGFSTEKGKIASIHWSASR